VGSCLADAPYHVGIASVKIDGRDIINEFACIEWAVACDDDHVTLLLASGITWIGVATFDILECPVRSGAMKRRKLVEDECLNSNCNLVGSARPAGCTERYHALIGENRYRRKVLRLREVHADSHDSIGAKVSALDTGAQLGGWPEVRYHIGGRGRATNYEDGSKNSKVFLHHSPG